MFWKRGDEASSRRGKPQREWTAGEPLTKAQGAPVAKQPGAPATNAPATAVAKGPSTVVAKTPATVVAKTPATIEVVAPTPVLRPALGPETSVTGRLSFTMPTGIDGKLRGEVHATDLLLIGEQGYVEGIVRAPKLVVLGEVRGEVRGAERVQIGPGGRVMGSVETYSLVVEEGGCLDGDCRIAPPRVAVHVLRPVVANGSA